MSVKEEYLVKHQNHRDRIVLSIYRKAETIAKGVVQEDMRPGIKWEEKLDDILTAPFFGGFFMLLLLGGIFWLTITGANYPSQLIAGFLFGIEEIMVNFLTQVNAPQWFTGLFVQGMYRTLAWVVSVMLPPMAIFFPLFTLLEDLGYLPRVAFNLDYLFKKCGTHGKQALTMCMGFGCNAAGITACRIIDSPRERLIAILTNNFVPCNGRFPTLILICSIFFAGVTASAGQGIVAALGVLAIVLLGIGTTLLISLILSKTLLKGVPSTFTLELPPFRKPQVGQVIVRSIFDRTLFVLMRAVVVAAPAGLVIWTMANTYIGDISLLTRAVTFVDPFARAIGLDGIILMAFILGLPANEIVVPIMVMAYLATGAMMELSSLQEMKELLINKHNWTWLTALNMMLFSLLHYPCSTTLITIFRETRSKKWTFLAFLIPTIVAVFVCFLVTQTANLLGLVF